MQKSKDFLKKKKKSQKSKKQKKMMKMKKRENVWVATHGLPADRAPVLGPHWGAH